MNWTSTEAKKNFSEMVGRALHEGPQFVTRHGRNCAVMLSQEEFDRLQAASGGAAESDKAVREYKDFKDWLFNAPVDLSKLDLTRNERDFAGTGAAIVNPWGEE